VPDTSCKKRHLYSYFSYLQLTHQEARERMGSLRNIVAAHLPNIHILILPENTLIIL